MQAVFIFKPPQSEQQSLVKQNRPKIKLMKSWGKNCTDGVPYVFWHIKLNIQVILDLFLFYNDNLRFFAFFPVCKFSLSFWVNLFLSVKKLKKKKRGFNIVSLRFSIFLVFSVYIIITFSILPLVDFEALLLLLFIL